MSTFFFKIPHNPYTCLVLKLSEFEIQLIHGFWEREGLVLHLEYTD